MQIKSWDTWWNEEEALAADDNVGCDGSNHHLNDRCRKQRLVLDVRPLHEVLERRLLSSTSSHIVNSENEPEEEQQVVVVHIPLVELPSRRFELPPRHVPFAILVTPPPLPLPDDATDAVSLPDDCLSHLAQVLSGVGDNDVSTHDEEAADAHGKRRHRLTCPWNVTAILSASLEETWQQASACGLEIVQNDRHESERHHDTTTTCTSVIMSTATSNDGLQEYFRPEPRLWSPDAMVQDVLLPLLYQTLSRHTVEQQQQQQQQELEIWDLGSGVGRDVCFLAEELLSFVGQEQHRPSQTQVVLAAHAAPLFQVVGLDQRYRNVQANEAVDFWKRRGVDAIASCRCVDLNDIAQVQQAIWGSSGFGDSDGTTIGADKTPNRGNESATRSVTSGSDASGSTNVVCFLAVRYWNRPLFEMLARAGCDDNHQRLPRGTIVAISQFGKPYANAPWPFPHPKERHVLERDELRMLFSTLEDKGNNQRDTIARTSPSWKILHDEVVLDSDHGRTLVQFVAQLQ